MEISSTEEQIARFNQIIEENLSVREVENLVKTQPTNLKNLKGQTSNLNSNQKVFKDFLGDRLSAKVSIQIAGNGSGKLSVHFNSENDLNRIIELLKR